MGVLRSPSGSHSLFTATSVTVSQVTNVGCPNYLCDLPDHSLCFLQCYLFAADRIGNQRDGGATMKRCMVLSMLCIALLWSTAWAGPASEPDNTVRPAENSLSASPQQIENPNTYMYGYVMQVGVATKGAGLTVVAIRPAGMHESNWETLPICGMRRTELNPAIGHWTLLVYSRNHRTGRGGFCRELQSAKIVE